MTIQVKAIEQHLHLVILDFLFEILQTIFRSFSYSPCVLFMEKSENPVTICYFGHDGISAMQAQMPDIYSYQLKEILNLEFSLC